MKIWFLSRTPGEQRTLMVSAVILVFMLLYLLVWSPVMNDSINLSRQVHEQQKLLSWMKDTAAEIQQLSTQRPTQRKNSGTSLLTLVDQTIKRQQLNAYLHRLEPQGSNKVQIWLKQIPFDALIQWLQLLQKQHGITIITISAQKQTSPGTVDTRVVLGDQ